MDGDNIDLVDIAENAYDAAVADNNADSDNDQDQQQDDVTEQQDVVEQETSDNEEESQSEENEEATKETEQAQASDETQNSDEESSDDSVDEKTEQAPQITDEQLIAELQRRGLSVVNNKQQQEQQAYDNDPRFAKPSELPDEVWGRMSDENRYIYNQLPYMEIRGKDGTVIRVKTDDQIPEGFEFASEAEKNRFYAKDLPAQSLRAERLNDQVNLAKQRYTERTTQQATAKYVVDTIDKLQRDGVIPKFKAKPRTKEFNNDPGVKLANEIIATWQQHRGAGENITLETAAQVYKALHPEAFKPVSSTTATDKVRKKKSANINGGSRGTRKDATSDSNVHVFPAGTKPSDIADYYLDKLD